IVVIIIDNFGFKSGAGPALQSVRLISRTKSLRGLVSLLLDIAPMITRVVVMYLVVIHVFAVTGVQLWMGEMNNRCFLGEDILTKYNLSLNPYYVSAPGEIDQYLCSAEDMNGNRRCADIPPYKEGGKVCTLEAPPENWLGNWSASGGDCVNWNVYYNVCRPDGPNPYVESLNFNNIRHAWITIFQVMTFEGWTEVMHYVMDTHSFWSFVYFVLVTLIGTFIFLNTCAVVIATFFAEAMAKSSEDSCSFTSPFLSWCCRLIKELLESLPNSGCSKGKKATMRVRKMVDGNLFSGGIMFAIFLDTITMAIDHHGQPLEMTEVFKVCNYLFTAVFLMEIVVKLLAYGYLYFMEGSNLFDFSIVMISLCDVAGVFDTGLPAMRALRMMRFGRLVNNFPYLKRQLMLLCRTLGKVFTLCLLMVLFVFAFGVMGMYLFGCRYDARHNFDSLTWSMVTIFQLLTQEDWNLVLYNAISSTSGWAAVYFVVTSMIGNNILLNVLMSIVVDSFQSAPPIETSTESDIQGPTESTHIGRDVSASRKRNPFQVSLFRMLCKKLVEHKYFDWSIMLFILIGCITNAFERPAILADSTERQVLDIFSDVLVAIFSVEMVMKVTAKGFVYGEDNYCKSFWNILDGFLVISSLGNLLFKAGESGESRMFSLIKVLRLLRALRPLRYILLDCLFCFVLSQICYDLTAFLLVLIHLACFVRSRVIKRVPKLKLAVEALVSSVKPMANIILISCVFLFFFGIVGVQLFKGQFSYCVGEDTSMIVNKSDCLAANYQWVQNTFNFDNLPQALLTLFVMYSKDGWLIVMYDGLDAVDVDQQPQKNYNQWLLTYFILFMVMSLFLLDMFIGVMVETFHQCHRAQKQEDHGQQHDSTPSTQNAVAPIEEKSAPTHCYIVKLSTSRVWDNVVTIIVSCNMLVMTFEHHGQPKLEYAGHGYFNSFHHQRSFHPVEHGTQSDLQSQGTESLSHPQTCKSRHCGFAHNTTPSDNCCFPSVLKDEKIKVLIRTITKTLSQVGHICLLFFFLFFIFAVLGVELFGKLACTPEYPCFGINRYTHFKNFPMALLTLYAVCTGDNWNGILKDTLRECRPDDDDCSSYLRWASPLYFITFVIVAQFVLANLVVAAIVQALEDST
ncbi:unnamed protein product, partial [Menidia menidia]